MVKKMRECVKDRSNQGCAGTEAGDGRRGRDNDTINKHSRALGLVGVEQAD